jgi:hypothetical protein
MEALPWPASAPLGGGTMERWVATRDGVILTLRLQGMGFQPEDAAVLVRLWEAGASKEELKAAAEALGYGPVPTLEAALEDVRTREASDSDGSPT